MGRGLDPKKVSPGASKSILSPIILEWELYAEIVAWVLFSPREFRREFSVFAMFPEFAHED